MAGVVEDSVVLWDMCMDRRSISRNTVDKSIVRCQHSLCDLFNGLGHSGGEQEGLPFRSWRKMFSNRINVRTESHVEEGISFIQNELCE